MLAQKPVLHLVLLNLRSPPASSAGGSHETVVQAILSAFARLAEIDGVLHLGATQAASEDSTHSLAMFALLSDAAALEEFGTHRRHIEYLQSAVLPHVSGLATADVVAADFDELSRRRVASGDSRAVGPLPPYRAAACFCASFQPTTYEWQIRSLFEGAAQLLGNATIGGLAVNDRQRFRAAGLALWPDTDDWSPGRRSDSFRRLWDDCWGPAATDQAWVVGPAAPIGLTARGVGP